MKWETAEKPEGVLPLEKFLAVQKLVVPMLHPLKMIGKMSGRFTNESKFIRKYLFMSFMNFLMGDDDDLI